VAARRQGTSLSGWPGMGPKSRSQAALIPEMVLTARVRGAAERNTLRAILLVTVVLSAYALKVAVDNKIKRGR